MGHEIGKVIIGIFAVISMIAITIYGIELSSGKITLDQYVGKVTMEMIPTSASLMLAFGGLGVFIVVVFAILWRFGYV